MNSESVYTKGGKKGYLGYFLSHGCEETVKQKVKNYKKGISHRVYKDTFITLFELLFSY